eukprot:9068906-Pyramimonas_sp.AAC.1
MGLQLSHHHRIPPLPMPPEVRHLSRPPAFGVKGMGTGKYQSSVDAREPQHRLQTTNQGVHRLNRGDALGPQP